jgi:hypothetical protein
MPDITLCKGLYSFDNCTLRSKCHRYILSKNSTEINQSYFDKMPAKKLFYDQYECEFFMKILKGV